MQSLVPLLVREETDKRGSQRRAFKINPPSKNIRNEQTVELNSAAVVQIWHTIDQSELWGFYWSEKLMTQTNCWLSELGGGKKTQPIHPPTN
jgi:hypothetical protein